MMRQCGRFEQVLQSSDHWALGNQSVQALHHYDVLHCRSSCCLVPSMSVTSVRIQPDVEESLEAISGRLGRSKSWLINQALREFIGRAEENSARWQQTLGALDSVAKGRLVEADAVHDWLNSWGGPNELKAPKVKR